MTFEEWLQYGLNKGWCGPSVCFTHDGIPVTEAEETDEDMFDNCIHGIRFYEDADVKAQVEANHSPSVWRATNSGYTL